MWHSQRNDLAENFLCAPMSLVHECKCCMTEVLSTNLMTYCKLLIIISANKAHPFITLKFNIKPLIKLRRKIVYGCMVLWRHEFIAIDAHYA